MSLRTSAPPTSLIAAVRADGLAFFIGRFAACPARLLTVAAFGADLRLAAFAGALFLAADFRVATLRLATVRLAVDRAAVLVPVAPLRAVFFAMCPRGEMLARASGVRGRTERRPAYTVVNW